MVKRRERRVPPSADRREDLVEGSKRAVRRAGVSAPSPRLDIVLFLFVLIAPAIAALVYRIKYAPRTNRVFSSYVHQQGLVKTDVNDQEILTGTDLLLEGRHNADIGWISELRMKGNAWVLPRVVLEAFPKELLHKKKQRNKAIDMIITKCKSEKNLAKNLVSWHLFLWERFYPFKRGWRSNHREGLSIFVGQAQASIGVEKNSREHLFFYSDDHHVKHAVFYPSLKSIFLRLEGARSWGVGISI